MKTLLLVTNSIGIILLKIQLQRWILHDNSALTPAFLTDLICQMWYVNGEMYFFFFKVPVLPAMDQNPAAVEKVETQSSLLGEQKKKKTLT